MIDGGSVGEAKSVEGSCGLASFPCFLTTQTQLISSATHYQYTSRIITLRLRGSKQLAGWSLGRKRWRWLLTTAMALLSFDGDKHLQISILPPSREPSDYGRTHDHPKTKQ